MKVGYVGLGAMGSALARWLIADHELWVWDINPAAIERFTGQGGRAAGSLAELARHCDVVFLCLPRSQDVEMALFGNDGLFDGLTAGNLVIDQTSGIGAQTLRFAQRLAERGVMMLDAPVAGGVVGAEAGTITIMVSGPAAAIDLAMPAFNAMTQKVFRAGEQQGTAQTVKTLNNMMNLVFRVATLETVALAVKLGVPLPDITQALVEGIASNHTCRTVLRCIMEGRTTGDFALALMLKDANQALMLGMDAQVPMPLSALARGVLQQNIHISGPQAKLDDVIVFMEKVTGVRYRGADRPAVQEAGERERVTEQIVCALAASNRATVYEILTLAARMGLQLDNFGEIVRNGSSWSQECETILAELAGEAPAPTRTIGKAVDALQALERRNQTLGVASVMLGQVRTFYEAAAFELGRDGTVDRLAALYDRTAGSHLADRIAR
ncbi:MAG: NAD(P)-dependent oxidoreductase [Burkholderiaceae bacterium]